MSWNEAGVHDGVERGIKLTQIEVLLVVEALSVCVPDVDQYVKDAYFYVYYRASGRLSEFMMPKCQMPRIYVSCIRIVRSSRRFVFVTRSGGLWNPA